MQYSFPVNASLMLAQLAPPLSQWYLTDVLLHDVHAGWTRLFNNLPADFPNMPLPLRLLMKLRTANTAINHAT